MLRLHQQQQAAWASAHITNSLVLPPDIEIVASVSILSPSGIQPGGGGGSLTEPKPKIVLLWRTTVSWWAVPWTRRNGRPVYCCLIQAWTWWHCHPFRVLVT